MSRSVVVFLTLSAIGVVAYCGSAQTVSPVVPRTDLGRYQLSPRRMGSIDEMWMVDTATGHCWAFSSGRWTDQGNPTREPAQPAEKPAAVPVPAPAAAPAPQPNAPKSEVEKINDIEIRVGEPQFTLTWDSRADLDLHVIEPGGAELFWENRNGKKGGMLDVDDLDGFGPENVYWSGGPAGEYKWFVHYYGGLGGLAQPTRWKVRIKKDGKTSVVSGELAQIGQKSKVETVTVEPKADPPKEPR